MKILTSWLKDYIDIDGLNAQAIAEALSNLGFPNEGIACIGDDAVIDLEVTSNRGDCLSYIGVARELSAVTDRPLKLPQITLNESDKNINELAGVEIQEPQLCGRYTAAIIEGVKVGPSPDWLVKRLEAVGLRSVNNVVDATNYAMLETGQPPHAFDYNKIEGHKIIVRKAREGEQIVSIDGTKCQLDTNMLVIADAKVPVAIAGVMGGLESEVSEITTAVLLEDAHFAPLCVRTTSRKLSLPSEASYRFERIVDIERIDWASRRTAQLIVQVAGGKVVKGLIDAYPQKPAIKNIQLRLSRLKTLLGIEVPTADAIKILTGLNFAPKLADGTIACEVPTWRSDIYREVDLIEEIIRVYGYNRIPIERKINIEVIPADKRQKLVNKTSSYLNSCGFYETINVTFVADEVASLFTKQDVKTHLAVKDVTRKNINLLRQTLLGSLFEVLKSNIYAKNTRCRIYEIADTFIPSDKPGTLPNEKTKLGLVCEGELQELRGAIEEVIKNFDKDAVVNFKPAEMMWARVGAEIIVNDKIIGFAGLAGDKVKQIFDFKNTVAAAEIDLEELMALQKGVKKIKPIPRFPSIERDLSIVVDESVRWTDIVCAINKVKCEQLENIRFVEIYRGKGIPAGKKSVTLSLSFRDEDGTLKHETVDGFQGGIVQSLKETASAELRTF